MTALELGRAKILVCHDNVGLAGFRALCTPSFIQPVGGTSFFHPQLPKGQGLPLPLQSSVTSETGANVLLCPASGIVQLMLHK